MLRRNHDLVVAILTGFMFGSLRKVWPWKVFEPVGDTFVLETNYIPSALNGEVILALTFMAVGILLVLVVEHFANRRVAIA
jgi:putative membrane protein